MKKLICIILAMLLLTACGAPATEETTATTQGITEVSAQLGGEKVVFEPWEEDGVPASGTYYLTKDVELGETVVVSGDLKLHLNGHTILAQKDVPLGSMFSIPAGATMTLVDHELPADLLLERPEDEEDDPYPEVPGGKIASNRVFSGTTTISSMFMVEGELTIAGGHIDASEMNLEDRANGLVVYIKDGGKANMTGGVITGGTTWSFLKPEEVLDENGEVIEIIEPEVYYGYAGAVYVDKGGEFNLSGGIIWRGSASKGGNIYVAGDETGFGVLNMSGGEVVCGEATAWGGNICVDGKAYISGGVLKQGRSYGHGGNMYLTGQLEMTGGIMQDGQCDFNSMQNKRGGNLAVNGLYATVKITNAEFYRGVAGCKETHGGNIAVFGYGAVEFEVGEGTLLQDGRGHRGGNIYIGHFLADVPEENMDYVFTKVTMGGGTTTYRGANMCCDTKNNARRIQVTFNDCITTVEDVTELNLAIGAGATDNTRCDIFINGGTWNDGGMNLYGNSTLTATGVTFNGCDPSGTGIFTADETTTGLTPTEEATEPTT